jgi:catechol 2,3-dioxygenase
MTTIDPNVQIGHVHLRVAELERAVAFYEQILGFQVTGRLGDQMGFLAAGTYHHHIGLNTFDDVPTGLYHAAIRYPSRPALARAVRQVLDSGHPVSHGSDHGASESVYLDDPDGNGLELYYDRPFHEWPRTPGGELALVNFPVDVEELVSS